MEWIGSAIEFFNEHSGVLAGVAAGLFAISESLASIEWLRANSVFQLFHQIFARLAKKEI